MKIVSKNRLIIKRKCSIGQTDICLNVINFESNTTTILMLNKNYIIFKDYLSTYLLKYYMKKYSVCTVFSTEYSSSIKSV